MADHPKVVPLWPSNSIDVIVSNAKDTTEDARSGEFEESRRGWKKCSCLIHASGSLRGRFKRKNTGRNNWHEAKIVAAEWEKAGLWDSEIVVPVASVGEISAPPKRMTIGRAIKTFLDELHEHAAPARHKKYRLLLKKFETFSESRGFVMIDQWGPMDVREFRIITVGV